MERFQRVVRKPVIHTTRKANEAGAAHECEHARPHVGQGRDRWCLEHATKSSWLKDSTLLCVSHKDLHGFNVVRDCCKWLTFHVRPFAGFYVKFQPPRHRKQKVASRKPLQVSCKSQSRGSLTRRPVWVSQSILLWNPQVNS